MVEGIIYRYPVRHVNGGDTGSVFRRRQHGIAWRDVPDVFGPWQSIWTWHRRMSAEGTWDVVLARLLTAAADAGIIDWAVAVDSTIARAHQHATNITRDTGGWVELHESDDRAA
ncbi:hypothetical protein MSAS_39690 [Mycobacterium saskatchewanense]|nr:hypothetical protein MSAS_39690 [Mycobacterium saskatchewanense]